jgi:hypothetical protein
MIGGAWHGDFGLDWRLPRVCLTLPVFAALGLVWAYWKKSATTVGFYVPLVGWWLVLLPLTLHFDDNPVFFIGSVGALLLIVAEIHDDGSRLAIPYRLWGGVTCMVILSILSFFELHREFARIQHVVPFVVQSVVITALSLAVFAIAFVLHARRIHASFTQPLVAFAIRQWLPLSMAVLMLLMPLWYAAWLGEHEHGLGRGFRGRGGDEPWLISALPTLAANIGMLVLALWLMMFGLREDRGFPAAGGVVFFLLWSVLRYTEYFSDHGGMLGAACMFFMCGAAIFGFAIFWHQRKKWRARISDERE